MKYIQPKKSIDFNDSPDRKIVKTSAYSNRILKDEADKHRQRDYICELSKTQSILLMDSDTFIDASMIGKIREENPQDSYTRVDCVNGDSFAIITDELKQLEKYNIYCHINEIYHHIVKYQTYHDVIWFDSMSRYDKNYIGYKRSIRGCIQLLCKCSLLNNVHIIMNTNYSRKNKRTKISKKRTKHRPVDTDIRNLVKDLSNRGHITSTINMSDDMILFTEYSNTAQYKEYKDSSEMIYIELKVQKKIIDLTIDD